MPEPPRLRMEGITKAFAGTTALAGVDFALERGEVHALVGENGAGKSTLLKVLTGAYRRDRGDVLLDGEIVDFRSPGEAAGRGVAAVYQEVPLLGRLTVAENLLLNREPTRWGLLDRRRLNAAAGAILATLGLDIDPAAMVGSLSLARRQMVAVARGVSLGEKVLVLDEPTSSLSGREVDTLFEVVRRAAAAGAGVVYVSHRFDELYAVCGRVTVLRDGRHVATRSLANVSRGELVGLMLGKELAEAASPPAAAPAAVGKPLLKGEGLRRGRALKGVTVEVRRGEVVGLAGLLGSGRSATARALFGLDPPDGGSVTRDGRPFDPRTPREAVAAGVAFVSEDRRAEGIVPDLSVRENLTLAALPLLTRFGVVSPGAQRAVVDRFMARLRIKADPYQPIRELSGGNQQKVLLARWLCREPDVLLLDEPTRGIDVGARAEIEALIRELAAGGMGVLLVSSELAELTAGCGRVVVLRDGRGVAELAGSAATEAAIVRAMAGEEP